MAVMLNALLLSSIMINALVLTGVMLSVVMLNDVALNVQALIKTVYYFLKVFAKSTIRLNTWRIFDIL